MSIAHFSKYIEGVPTIRPAIVVLLLFIPIFLGISACSTPKIPEQKFPLVRPEITLQRMNAGRIRLMVTISGSGSDTSTSLQFVRQIYDVKAIFSLPEKGNIDTIPVNLSAFGMPTQDRSLTSLTLNGEEIWDNPSALAFDSVYCELIIVSVDSTRYHDKQGAFLPAQSEKQIAIAPLMLRPKVEDITDSSAIFALVAERKRQVREEYFPDSEHFRVIITSTKGEVVWASNHGKNYLQMISGVKPERLYENQRYEIYWNGTRNDGSLLPAGDYTAQLILTSKPVPYSTTIQFSWKGKK